MSWLTSVTVTPAAGDAGAAAAVEHFGMNALFGGHRMDDDLHAIEGRRVDLALGERLVAAGQGRDELLHAADLVHALVHFQEVVQVELGLEHALGLLFFELLFLEFGSRLYQAHHVAHAQNALGHALGVELFERVGLFRPRR